MMNRRHLVVLGIVGALSVGLYSSNNLTGRRNQGSLMPIHYEGFSPEHLVLKNAALGVQHLSREDQQRMEQILGLPVRADKMTLTYQVNTSQDYMEVMAVYTNPLSSTAEAQIGSLEVRIGKSKHRNTNGASWVDVYVPGIGTAKNVVLTSTIDSGGRQVIEYGISRELSGVR